MGSTTITVQRGEKLVEITLEGDVATCNEPCLQKSPLQDNFRFGYGRETLCRGVDLKGNPGKSQPADAEHFPKCGMISSG